MLCGYRTNSWVVNKASSTTKLISFHNHCRRSGGPEIVARPRFQQFGASRPTASSNQQTQQTTHTRTAHLGLVAWRAGGRSTCCHAAARNRARAPSTCDDMLKNKMVPPPRNERKYMFTLYMLACVTRPLRIACECVWEKLASSSQIQFDSLCVCDAFFLCYVVSCGSVEP